MISSPTLWMSAMGCAFLVAGLIAYRRELFGRSASFSARALALGPVFIAAAMAAFAAEHFTLARAISQMIPKFMPQPLVMAYLVGVAHLSLAVSFVARRCMRWSTFLLGLMLTLFVLLLHLPGAIGNPHERIRWIVTVRETTFALGAFSLFAIAVRDVWLSVSNLIATLARFWTGGVIVFFGVLHFVYPRLWPGVPNTQPTASWVPAPIALSWVTGVLLVIFGAGMWVRKFAAPAFIGAGMLMVALTIVLFVPQSFLVHGVGGHVNAINFVADTLLFAGTMLAIGAANCAAEPASLAVFSKSAA